jgi:hypothetical protein
MMYDNRNSLLLTVLFQSLLAVGGTRKDCCFPLFDVGFIDLITN